MAASPPCGCCRRPGSLALRVRPAAPDRRWRPRPTGAAAVAATGLGCQSPPSILSSIGAVGRLLPRLQRRTDPTRPPTNCTQLDLDPEPTTDHPFGNSLSGGRRSTPDPDGWLTANTDSQSDSQRDGRAWIDVDKCGTPGAPPDPGWTSIADAGPWSVDLQNHLWGRC